MQCYLFLMFETQPVMHKKVYETHELWFFYKENILQLFLGQYESTVYLQLILQIYSLYLETFQTTQIFQFLFQGIYLNLLNFLFLLNKVFP